MEKIKDTESAKPMKECGCIYAEECKLNHKQCLDLMKKEREKSGTSFEKFAEELRIKREVYI